MDDIVNIFSLLSDRTRLRILLLLKDKELCVCEIFGALDMSQPRVSRQLAILKQSKILKDRREGKWIYYRIDENEYTKYLTDILALIPDWLSEDKEYINDRQMVEAVCLGKNNMPDCDCEGSGGEKFGE